MNRDPLFDSSLFYLVITDLKGQYLKVNDAFLNAFNFSWEDIQSRSFVNSVHPDDIPVCLAAAQQILAHPERKVEVDMRKPHGDGRMLWSRWEFSAAVDDDGELCGIKSVGVDITESKRQIEDLRVAQARVGLLLDNISEGFYVLNRNYEFVEINETACKTLDVKPSDVIGKSLWELYSDQDGLEYPGHFKQVMNKRTAVHYLEYVEEWDRWFDSSVHPVEQGIAVLFKDVTERKRLESKLHSSEQKLRAAFNSTSESFALIDTSFNYIAWNKTFESWVKANMNLELKEGMDIRSALLPEVGQQTIAMFQRAFEGEELEMDQDYSAAGFDLWIRSKVFPVYDDNNELIGAGYIGHDVTSIKQAEQDLLRKNNQLREVAWMNSHQIRRYVSNQLGLLHLLEKEDEKERNEIIQYLMSETENLDVILHDIGRKVSRLSEGPVMPNEDGNEAQDRPSDQK